MADTPWRMAQRFNRLNAEREILKAEEKRRELFLIETKNSEHAVLKGHIGQTFQTTEKLESSLNPLVVKDVFHVNPNLKNPPIVTKPGQWDPADPKVQGTWCFDTPGTVNTNQVFLQLNYLNFILQ